MAFFSCSAHPKFAGRLAPIILGLVFGLAGGYLLGTEQGERAIFSLRNSFAPIEQDGAGYAFIRPLLAYRTPEATLLGDYTSLDSSVQSIVDTATNSGQVSSVGVYFRDLDAGKWVGVNQEDTYHPASLLKVPVMFAYDKEAENNPSILNQSFVYDPTVVPENPFEATSTLTAGHSYSVESLTEHMIIDSDNGATFTLLNYINPEFLHTVYAALGIQDPGDNSENYQISARSYGLFFRILYNATYLSPEVSEQALKLLSESTFTDGLIAGVPKGTVVAHKFGEYVLSNNGVANGVELSDCGIVYYPSHPYLLCVMTSAADVPTAEKIIADISRTSYTAVAKQYSTVK